MEDGTMIVLPDVNAGYVSWEIAFSDLSDQEAATLRTFFAGTQGDLFPFMFLDPLSNLLAWSEDFSQSAWNQSGLTVRLSVSDPVGGSLACCLQNLTAANLTLGQDTQIPGSASVCFSAYLRSDSPTTLALTRSAGRHLSSVSVNISSNWQRFWLSCSFPGAVEFSHFAIDVPAGTSLEIYGPQVEAQTAPGEYVSSGSRTGVYPNARFDMSRLEITATGPNRNACVVSVRSNLPGGTQ